MKVRKLCLTIVIGILVFLNVPELLAQQKKDNTEARLAKIKSNIGLPVPKSIKELVAKNMALAHKREIGLGNKVYHISANDTAYVVMNYQEGGYVIVSNDFGMPPVLMYSDDGNIDAIKSINPHQKLYLDAFAEYASYVKANKDKVKNTKSDSSVDTWIKRWDQMSETVQQIVFDAPPPNVPGQTPSGNFLLHFNWDQDNFYGPDDSPVGCVATAMGQLMKYYNYPLHGTGNKCYTDNEGEMQGQHCADYNTYYKWEEIDNLPNGTSEIEDDRIMFHCAVGVEMNFEADGSGSYTEDAKDVMKTYFNYNLGADFLLLEDFSLTDWEDMLVEQLQQGQPLIYQGIRTDTNGIRHGHAWVCDGFNTATGQFHMNWGWGGNSNTWVTLADFNEAGRKYYLDQAAIFDLYPADDYSTNEVVSGLIINQGEKAAHAARSTLTIENTTIKSGATYRGLYGEELILGPGFNLEVGAEFEFICLPELSTF